MDRVKADKRPTAFAHVRQHFLQIAKIADPPVVVRTQRIELHAGAPQLFAFTQCLRFVAAFRGNNHPTMKTMLALSERQSVVALRQLRRKVELFTARGMALMFLTLFGD
ncbi:hypothetical protein D3C76_1500680 [compost metagenome]